MSAVLGLFGAFDILTSLWPFCIAQRVENSWCENKCFLMHFFFPFSSRKGQVLDFYRV